MKWPRVPIGELCLPSESKDPRDEPDQPFLYVDIASIDRQLKTISTFSEILGAEAPSRARKRIQADDILVSTVRPNLNAVAVVPHELDGQIASTGFCVLRPQPSVLHPKFLFYFAITPDFVDALSSRVRGAHYPAVSDGDVKRLAIPLPPLSEQRRIVEILDQADALRKKRAEADAKAARILPALFYKMFGDPATNSKGWPVRPLGEAWQIVGGGTPSRTVQEFWRGSVPWASPKDMKTEILSDTEEHITAEAVSSSATRLVPPGSLLIVFRSGILVHTFPAAITAIDVAINQDVKALQPMGKNTNEYLFGLFAAAPTVPLACVKKGATVHNVDGARFSSLPIPLPPASLQRRFAEHLQTALGVKAQGRSVGRQIEDLFRTLLHRAFTGELTARWREAHMKELLAEMEAQSKLLEAVR